MTEQTRYTPQAISGVADPDSVRVCIFINNEILHTPLNGLLASLLSRISELEQRVEDLENA